MPSSRDAWRTLAGMKGQLANFGIGIHPQARVMESATPRSDAGVILVERVGDVAEPEYCVHGYVHCVRCDEICYLGDKSAELVIAGAAVPLCVPCARETFPPDAIRRAYVDDHRRADGPH